MKYFDKVLSLEPKNAAALNNRGNIFMIDDKYQEAQKAYLAATQISAQGCQCLDESGARLQGHQRHQESQGCIRQGASRSILRSRTSTVRWHWNY